MSTAGRGTYSMDEIVKKFRAEGSIAIVGASLAGLRAAEALREKGFEGSLTIIGDEPHEPYDRPPLSKQVLKGWVPADHTKLPRLRRVDANWKLGVAAIGLDRIAEHEHRLLAHATEAVQRIPGLRLIGTARDKAGRSMPATIRTKART